MNLTSKKVTVNKSGEELCLFLSDVKNFEQLMPENISKFEVIRDNAFVFALKGMPEIALEVKETNPPNEVVLGAISDKLPFTLTANVEPIDETTSKTELLFEGDFNSMMAMMIKSPISKFLETLTTNMEKL
ncbi:SRPBCC family protein [Marixanthomonas ophiurae]|uniref:SRPBCC family protein n=1 Tax=Marixanthomonas ophiurae TaxID=387659 RepID=A0A3E1QCN7_9FLAO|nr:SRPBCC family protein [Marixanthomonas ophiurae]RFN59919.1 SRPBCC family protein [Marixanthomonas ophiurae]